MSALCDAQDSILLIIDPQQRLIPAIHEASAVLHRCTQLANAARDLAIPVIGTEQNPAGLGPNVAELRALCDATLPKFHFNAAAEPGLLARLPPGRATLVVAGCEAHVCVLQTVIGLLESGRPVKLVLDAVGARRPHDRDAALARAQRLGADIVTTEMVIFEWLRSSQHPVFKKILPSLR